MKFSRMLFAVGVVSFSLMGCAMIFNGSSSVVSIRSNVKGAEILVDGSVIGKTPYTGSIPNGKKILTVTKSGYEDVSMSLTSNLNGWFWVDLFLYGIPTTTDLATGAAWSYSQADFYVNLDRSGEEGGNDDNRRDDDNHHDGDAKPASPSSPWSFRMDSAIKQYTMMNYDVIQSELAAGKGPMIEGLVYAVPGDDALQIADLAQIMRDAHGDVVTFGEQTASYAQKAF